MYFLYTNSNLNRIDNGRIYLNNIAQETQSGRVNFDKPFEGGSPVVQLSLFQDNEAPIYFSELQFMVYSTDFNGFNYAIYCKNGTYPAISLVWTAISVK